MVFARTDLAASKLCAAWRENRAISSDTNCNAEVKSTASVEKIYHARVLLWPPYQQYGQTKGTIDLPMAPSKTERLKWEVVGIEGGGKMCRTFWRVLGVQEQESNNHTDDAYENQTSIVTLELQPVTGRTHQLRVHCAEVGSGIIGDSLYGDDPIRWKFGTDGGQKSIDVDAKQLIKNNTFESKHPHSCSKSEDNTTKDSQQKPQFLYLHSYSLSFPHPDTGKIVQFVDPALW
mmetsp:Transcript_939/g.1839  ORF Transcript_939/g.1839 Transcript_939/m.1839 type:complete len:233 (-) Transcript_939:84-782(-)